MICKSTMGSSPDRNKRTQDLKQASRRLCLGGGLFWWLFLWSGASVGFRWLAIDGLVDKQYTFWMTCWAGFFAGFVATLSTRLQIRRKLLIGKIEPTLSEWKWLLKGKPNNLGNSLWPAVLLSGFLLALVAGGIQLAASSLGDGSTYFRPQHVFYAGWLPALFLPFLIHHHARQSLRRFVIAIEGSKPQVQINRSRYIWLHNVLPYALFNASGGLVVAFSRFTPFYQRGESVDSHTLAWHLALTTLAISLFVVTAAKFKTRVDFLSPIQFNKLSPLPGKRTWRLAYTLAAPFVTYFLLRLAMTFTGRESLRPIEALGLKLIVCLSLALLTAHWAVSSTLARLEQAGLKKHPYVRLHRFLRTAGIVDPFRRKRTPD